MSLFRLILPALLLLLAAFSTYAQDPEQSAVAESRELPAEDVAEFDARLVEIEAHKIAVARLAQQLEETDGMIADVLGLRMDALWSQMFDDTVTLARDIVSKRSDGFEVAAIVEKLTEDLRAFPVQAAETMERLRAKVVFPAADLEPAEFVIADQRLLQATMKVDAIYGSLITYVEIADTLDLDGSAERDYLIDVLENSAANRSVFLQVALVDVDVLRAAAASLPGDASVASLAAAFEARIKIASTALQQMINLMGRMQLETTQYRQQVLKVTGELTADVLDVAGKFRCACGSCEEPELAECTCPTAVEEKELISRELRRGQGEAEVVRLVERRYGGLKSRFPSMLSSGPPATESAAEGFAQSQLGDYAEGDARRASGLRVLAAAVDSTAVVSRFTCACGECQDHALSACDCDHPRGAVEMKAFIDHKISQQRHTVDELVRAVAYEYGHLVESAEA
ncbi:MAG: hypothetical protein IIA12_01885, partial [Proteobacteria bacterium]|nr:hypothetical protein [Pseudomonadota bacterium]